MNIVLQTAPVLEPITLGELKSHLRVSSETLDGNLTLTQSLSFASHAVVVAYTHLGSGVDVLGSEAEVLLHAGTNGATGTNDTKIQESDDNITFSDWTGGAFTQVTTANDNADYKIQYTGVKQYIRTASKVLLAACEFGTSILVNAATTAEDDLLTDLISAARMHVEDMTSRQLITATWEYYLDEWPRGNYIELPFGNLQSAGLAVSWKDTDGTETTLTLTTDYLIETNGAWVGRIVLPYAETWPSGTLYPSNPIKISFSCGWTTAALVPSPLKSAILLICGDLYENREGQTYGTNSSEYTDNKTVQRLIKSYRLWDQY